MATYAAPINASKQLRMHSFPIETYMCLHQQDFVQTNNKILITQDNFGESIFH